MKLSAFEVKIESVAEKAAELAYGVEDLPGGFSLNIREARTRATDKLWKAVDALWQLDAELIAALDETD